MACAIHGINSLCGIDCEGHLYPAGEVAPHDVERESIDAMLDAQPEGPAYPEGESTERVGHDKDHDDDHGRGNDE